ncbi:MAG: radical SAM protein [Pseudomonadota bacterium]
MKVLLVQPSVDIDFAGANEKIACLEPLHLEYLGAGIQDMCDVKILDLRLDDNLKQVLADFKPDVVGVTGFSVSGGIMKNVLREAKQTNPDIVTIAGSIFVTSYPTFFDNGPADILVIGEGVFPFQEILQKIEKKQGFSDIAGIALPQNGKMVLTQPRPFPQVDSLPFPNRSLTQKHRNDYFLPIFKPVALLRTSVGCPFKCNFCLQHKISGGKYFPRKPELVLEELKTIKEPNIAFADDETFLKTDRLMKLAQLIEEEGIKKRYHACVRADTIVRHREVIEKWIDIGLHRVLVGFESFREKDLSLYSKSSSVSTNEKAIHILNDLDVDYTADFIIRPDYGVEDFRELRAYVRKNNIQSPSFPVLTPYPGTALFEEVKDQLLTYDFSKYDQNHSVIPTKLPPKIFYEELSKMYEVAFPQKGIFERVKHLMTLPKGKIYEMVQDRLKYNKRRKQTKNLYKDFENL